jgi:hypothetical protein
MRFVVEHPHPILQILFAIFVLTLVAFALEGCPALGKVKYQENQKAAAEIFNGDMETGWRADILSEK